MRIPGEMDSLLKYDRFRVAYWYYCCLHYDDCCADVVDVSDRLELTGLV